MSSAFLAPESDPGVQAAVVAPSYLESKTIDAFIPKKFVL